MTGGSAELGDLVFAATGLDVEVAEGAGEPKWPVHPRQVRHGVLAPEG